MSNKITVVQDWINQYIIKLNLCPFAKWSVENDKVKIIEIEECSPEKLEQFIYQFFENHSKIDTLIGIFPSELEYLDFLEMYYMLEDLLEAEDGFSDLKLVPFHPDYQHEGVKEREVHYSNRSPFPLIQILSKRNISERTVGIDIQQILDANQTLLSEMGVTKLEKIMDEFRTTN